MIRRASRAESSRGEPDVIVVGGGPAGSTTAGLLARRGWHVELLERAHFPRPKPCGECLNPGAVRALARLGLLERVLALQPARLRGWDFLSRGGAPPVEGRFPPEVGEALAVARSRFDATLLADAESGGAGIRHGARVIGVEPADESGRAVVRTRVAGAEALLFPRIVVGADGLRSVVARRLGAHRRKPRLRKASMTFRVRGSGPSPNVGRLLLDPAVTVGIAPVRGSTDGLASLWNVTLVVPAGAPARTLARDPSGALHEALDRVHLPWRERPEVVDGPWASGPFDWPGSSAAPAPGVVLVGDAAGYYDPLTGQGIYRALRSAELAAEAIDRALQDPDRAARKLSRYARSVRQAFRPGRSLQRAVEAALSTARSRRLVLSRLAGSPQAAGALIAVTGDARPVSSLLRPRFVGAFLRP